jgi:hypothetical protein
MNNLKHLIQHHPDAVTVPEAIKKIYKKYTENGYKTSAPILNTFDYWLEDGTKIIVYWENGAFYEEAQI